MPVEMKECKSSNIAAHGYDPEKQELHVRFKGRDRVYIHSDVSPEVAKAFEAADSKGSHYAQHIKGKFQHR